MTFNSFLILLEVYSNTLISYHLVKLVGWLYVVSPNEKISNEELAAPSSVFFHLSFQYFLDKG